MKRAKTEKKAMAHVLFTRADPKLVEAIDKRLQERRDELPGFNITKADLVRELLWKGLGS